MRGVMILAIVMGVMLVVGIVVLVAVIIGRVEHPAAPPSAAHPYAAAPIDIPRGARVAAMKIAANRLILALTLPQGGQEIIVLDLATGARLGTIELRAAP